MIYRLTRQADRNIGEIYLYAAEQFGIRYADQYAADLDRVFDLIAAHPFMGRPADKIRPGLRRHEHAGHVVFYRQAGDGVLIVAVITAACGRTSPPRNRTSPTSRCILYLESVRHF